MPGSLINHRFPRSNQYDPGWIMESPMGAHPLWLTEWLTGHLHIEPHMRILDLGCGKAKSSIFLAREFEAEVWAVDLWTGADENLLRIEDAGVSDRVIPIHADARQLPFAGDFFDAVVCIDSFNYFGTDDLYLNYLARFVRVGGVLAFVSAGLMQDFGQHVPRSPGTALGRGLLDAAHTRLVAGARGKDRALRDRVRRRRARRLATMVGVGGGHRLCHLVPGHVEGGWGTLSRIRERRSPPRPRSTSRRARVAGHSPMFRESVRASSATSCRTRVAGTAARRARSVKREPLAMCRLALPVRMLRAAVGA